MSGYQPAVRRYTVAQRVNHWITAISLVLLALSGLSLFHPSLYFLTALFGGGTMTRILHPWIGVVLVLSFLGLFIRFVRLNLPVAEDGAWIKALPRVLRGDERNLPELGKYNAGQKLVFWAMTVLILVLVGSGVVVWHQYFAQYTSIEQQRVAILVHAIAAVCAILVWIIHVYAAIWVRGTVAGMTTGSVTAGWAWRHHRKWLREESAKDRQGDPRGPAPST
jgi:formate dehydrogenase subunit gamma